MRVFVYVSVFVEVIVSHFDETQSDSLCVWRLRKSLLAAVKLKWTSMNLSHMPFIHSLPPSLSHTCTHTHFSLLPDLVGESTLPDSTISLSSVTGYGPICSIVPKTV